MAEFIALLFMGIVAVLAGAFAINYFWKIGPASSIGYAAFFVVMVIVFGLSGIWIGASRHSWGVLAPLFAVMLGAAWLFVKFAPNIWNFLKKKFYEIQGK